MPVLPLGLNHGDVSALMAFSDGSKIYEVTDVEGNSKQILQNPGPDGQFVYAIGTYNFDIHPLKSIAKRRLANPKNRSCSWCGNHSHLKSSCSQLSEVIGHGEVYVNKANRIVHATTGNGLF